MRNKLVTIFAAHHDSFIVTQSLSAYYQFRKTGSGQILQPRQIYLSPVPIAPDSYRDGRQRLRHGGLSAGTPPAGGSAKEPVPIAIGIVSADGPSGLRFCEHYRDSQRAKAREWQPTIMTANTTAKHTLFCYLLLFNLLLIKITYFLAWRER
jgi:hypothetical protein